MSDRPHKKKLTREDILVLTNFERLVNHPNHFFGLNNRVEQKGGVYKYHYLGMKTIMSTVLDVLINILLYGLFACLCARK